MRKYKLGEVLGTGADAKVVRAIRRSDGSIFATKIIELKLAQEGVSFNAANAASGHLALQARAARVRRELEIHLNLPEHPHIVPCYEVFSGARRSYMVLGLCAGGTLLDFVCSEASARLLAEPGAARIARQVLEAIRFLHMNGIVHRDLKLENLLLKELVDDSTPLEDVHIQLADFGSARYLRKRSFERSATAHVGTLAYMAPEQHVGGTVDASLDMWSFGIVLAALCTGRHPLRDVPREQWHAEMQRDRLPDGASETAAEAWASMPEARNLAGNVLRLESSARITALQALKHPWITRHTGPPAPVGDGRRFASAPTGTARSTPAQRPRRVSFLKDFRASLVRKGAKLAAFGNAQRRRRASAPAKTQASQPSSPLTASPRLSALDRSSKSTPNMRASDADALDDEAVAELVPRLEKESREDVLRLPRVLDGLREVRKNRLQKTLLVLVALRAEDVEVKQALRLFEQIAPNRDYLTRDDVEDALLSNEGVSIRVADKLCDAFEGLSLDGSGKVSVAEFVAGVLSLRRTSRFEVAKPVLAQLDPKGKGRVDKRALADMLRLARAEPRLHDCEDIALSTPSALPSDDEIDKLVSDNVDGPELSYEEVVNLLFRDGTDASSSP